MNVRNFAGLVAGVDLVSDFARKRATAEHVRALSEDSVVINLDNIHHAFVVDEEIVNYLFITPEMVALIGDAEDVCGFANAVKTGAISYIRGVIMEGATFDHAMWTHPYDGKMAAMAVSYLKDGRIPPEMSAAAVIEPDDPDPRTAAAEIKPAPEDDEDFNFDADGGKTLEELLAEHAPAPVEDEVVAPFGRKSTAPVAPHGRMAATPVMPDIEGESDESDE